MLQISIVVTNMCCLARLGFLFTKPLFCILTSFCVSLLHAGLLPLSVSIFEQIE